jgi:uridine kinase
MPETDFIKQNSSTSFSAPFLLGVAGGSGSGKTYFSRALVDKLNTCFGEDVCELVYQDNFYIDQSKRFDHDGGSVNFDHPDSIDFSLLASCLKKLKAGERADIPVYDFATHTRKPQTLTAHPKKIIVVDGILIFHANEVCSLFDERIFFETPEELRFQRRLERDVKERGRKADGVHQQFFKQVKPMHDLYVEPSKKFAETIVKDVGHFEHVLNSYFEKLREV